VTDDNEFMEGRKFIILLLIVVCSLLFHTFFRKVTQNSDVSMACGSSDSTENTVLASTST